MQRVGGGAEEGTSRPQMLMHRVGQIRQIELPAPPGDVGRVIVGVAYAVRHFGMGTVGANHLHIPRPHRRTQAAVMKNQIGRFPAHVTDVTVFTLHKVLPPDFLSYASF